MIYATRAVEGAVKHVDFYTKKTKKSKKSKFQVFRFLEKP